MFKKDKTMFFSLFQFHFRFLFFFFFILSSLFFSGISSFVFAYEKDECLPDDPNILLLESFSRFTCKEGLSDLNKEMQRAIKTIGPEKLCSFPQGEFKSLVLKNFKKEERERVQGKVFRLFSACPQEIMEIKSQDELSTLFGFASLFFDQESLDKVEPNLYCLYYFYMSDQSLKLNIYKNQYAFMEFPEKFKKECHRERLKEIQEKKAHERIFSQKASLLGLNMFMEVSRFEDPILSGPAGLLSPVRGIYQDSLKGLEAIFDENNFRKIQRIYKGEEEFSFDSSFARKRGDYNLWFNNACGWTPVLSETFCMELKHCAQNEKKKWGEELSSCMAERVKNAFKDGYEKNFYNILWPQKFCHPMAIEFLDRDTSLSFSNNDSFVAMSFINDLEYILLSEVQSKLTSNYTYEKPFASLVGQRPDSNGNFPVLFSADENFEFIGAYAWDVEKNEKGPMLDSPNWGTLDSEGNRVLSGLYDGESLKTHAFGLHEIIFRRPDSDVGSLDTKSYIFELKDKKTAKVKQVKLNFPKIKEDDDKPITEIVSKSNAPPYKEMVKDSMLCGLLFYGDGIQTCEYGLEALAALDYSVRKSSQMTLKDLNPFLSGKSSPSVDYFLKLTHSNGYLYGSGVFKSCNDLNYYYLEKKGGTATKRAMHFVCQAKTCKDGVKSYSYSDFLSSVTQRKSPLFEVNLSCNSHLKSVYEMDLVGGKKYLEELGTVDAVTIANTRFNYGHIARFADLSILNALDNMLNYEDMRFYMPREARESIIFPDRDDYFEKAEQARRGYKSFGTEGNKITIEQL